MLGQLWLPNTFLSLQFKVVFLNNKAIAAINTITHLGSAAVDRKECVPSTGEKKHVLWIGLQTS